MSVTRGAAIGRYLVVEKLGAGAMGVVYRAYDPELDRSVALKLVGSDEMGATVTDNERARLMREAQAMARLSHPNVITVFDVGTIGKAVYVAMEFIDGVTLRAFNAETHAQDEILDVFLQAGRGLAEAHRAGIVHRDFKPDNVMIGRADAGDGRVRVLDFGLARSTGSSSTDRAKADDADTRSADADAVSERESLRSLASGRKDPDAATPSLDRSMTAQGMVMGTPAYMSPEQHLGATVDARSDQFSFCVSLFEALYGRRPFLGRTLATLATAVLAGRVDPPDKATAVPGRVRRVIDRGLAVDPDARFESMDALLRALRGSPRRRAGWAVGALGGAAAATGIALGIGGPPDDDPSAACTGAAPKLAEVWNDDARQRLARSFEATGLAYATEVWTSTAAILDERAEAWVAGHTEACEATRVRFEQSEELLDLRVACLDGQLRATQALLTALAEPDESALRGAIDAALALPDVDRCADLSRLNGGKRFELEGAAEQERARLALEIDAIEAQTHLGHYTRVLDRIGPVVESVRALEHPPTLADALVLQSTILAATREPKRAAEILEESFAASVEAGADRLAADLGRQLAFEWGSTLSDTATGRRWLAIGRAQLRRAGGDADIEANLWSSEGAIAVGAGDYETALQAHAKAQAHWEAAPGRETSLARTLGDIGAVLVQQGKPDDAAAIHEEAVALKEAVYGPHHPETAAALRELGTALSHARKFDLAAPPLHRALEIETAARGETSTKVAMLLDDLGRLSRARGDLEGAIASHRKAVAIWEAALGDPHPDLGVSILNLGYTLSAAGEFAEALAEFERALAMFQATSGPNHPYVVYASNASASALVDLERYTEALVHVERVLAMTDLQVDPTLVAETQFIGTHALWGTGTPSAAARARARQLATQAHDTYAAGPAHWAAERERIETWLASHP